MSWLKTLIGSILGLLILGSLTISGPVQAKTFRFAHATWVGYGPLYIAREKGYFADEGVEVDLIVMEDTKLRYAALAAGRVDGIATTVESLPLYLKSGVRFQYFGVFDGSNGADGIVSRKEIKTVADLKGKKVAFEQGSVSHFFLSVLLRQAGLSDSDITAVNMTAGDAGSAFVTGKVDAAVTWEPWLTRGRKAPHGHVLTDSSAHPTLITDVMVALPKTISSRRDDFAAFVRAWNRGVAYWRQHPEDGIAIMAKGVGGWLKDPKAFAEAVAGVRILGRDDGRSFFGTSDKPGPILQTVQYALDVWSDLGKLQTKVSPKELINYDFVGE